MVDELDPNVITSAVKLWQRLVTEKEVVVKFEKKDKTIRTMRCTLDFKRIPIPDRPKSINVPKILALIQKHKMIHVYDLDKKGWRTLPFEKIEYVDTVNQRYYAQGEGGK
ncbi:MAG: SH3 beta-barrel fold-containing protein [Candidatus Heimdallarchaeaceae archaeon]